MRRLVVPVVLVFLLISVPRSSIGPLEETEGGGCSPTFITSDLPASPIIQDEWLEYWTNYTGGDGGNLLYAITDNSNSTWWEVEVWNQTTTTLNQTAYVKKVSGESGHEHCYAVEGYTVYSSLGTSHPYQWDRWFDLSGVSVGTDIGPLESPEGDYLVLTVNTTETLTTQAGTFECWLANESQSYMGIWFYINYWIDKDSNFTVRATTEIPAYGILVVDELVGASWLNSPEIDSVWSEAGKFSAEISWNTDKEANSTVNYGESTDNLNMTRSDAGFVTSHYLVLTGLQPLTTYYFEVISADQWGNMVVDNNTGIFHSFTTLKATAPEISSITAVALSNSSVRISFDTDVATNATVWFDESEPLTSSVTNTTFALRHELDLIGLKEWTVYYYKVGVSDDIENRANSSIRSVRTLDQSAPVVISFEHVVHRDTLNLTLEANEDCRCEIYTGGGATSLSLAENRTTLSPIHVIVLSGLLSYSTIYFRLELIDPSGNRRIFLNGTQPYLDDIPDYLEPEISHPDDIFVKEGDVLPDLSWTVTDQTLESYEVIIDGTSQGVVPWSSGSLTFPLNNLDLAAGTHTIELVVRDAYGNTASDVVVVAISQRVTQPLTDDQTILLAVGALTIFVVVVVLWRRR
ncbi:MAG: fibronectin type III domain-containing protein [Promethearchaeota archaeon]